MGVVVSNGDRVGRVRRLLVLGAGAIVASAAVASAFAWPAAAADDAVRFQTSRVLVSEGDNRVTLRITRNATVALSEARVEFATEDHDASAGSDYVSTHGTVVLGVGQTAATIDVLLLDDRASESTERFHVVLTDPDHPGYMVDRTWVDVSDDDQWQDPALSTANNRPAQGAPAAAGTGNGSAVTTPARPAARNSTARSSSSSSNQSAAARNRSSRSTPFKLYRPAPAQPVTSAPVSASPVALLAVLAAVVLASVSARLWHHWRTMPDAVTPTR